jgi:galactokinase
MAIESRTAIAAAPNATNRINLTSDATAETITIDLSEPLAPDARGRWTNYPKGVLSGFRQLNQRILGFDGIIHSTVPVGAGLSSSAALEAATATLLEAVCETTLDPVQKALLCQKAEHEYAQVPCGIMDQFTSILGRKDHVLLLDCSFNEPSWIQFTDPTVSLLVINTNVRHQHADGQYAVRRRSCEAAARALRTASLRDASLEMLDSHLGTMNEMSMRCARHVIGEIARTLAAAQCVRVCDWMGLGELMDSSHDSLRNDYDASCPEVEIIVETARDLGPRCGVLGARLTGGGFGGCVVALIQSDAREEVAARIKAEYHTRTGITPELFISRAAAGATLTEL